MIFVLSRTSTEVGRVIGINLIRAFKFVVVNDKSYFWVRSVGRTFFLDKVF